MRISVTSRSFSRNTRLRQALMDRYPDADVTFNEAGDSLAGDTLKQFLSGCDAAIIGLEKINGDLLDAVPTLRTVAKYGVGIDNLDLAAMAQRGVSLGWTGGVNRRSVAELVIAFAISLLRQIPQTSMALRNGDWIRGDGRQLSNRTVGIVGCGHVGKDVAGLLSGFGSTVLAHDICDFSEYYAANGIEGVSLDDLLARADIVTLHVPFDETTRNLMNAERLAQMREGAILINAARGGIVDEAALKGALRDGWLAGAAFDVFAIEPPEDGDLLSLPNFLATPHIGGSAAEAVHAMGLAAIDGVSKNAVPDTADAAAG